MRQKCHRQHIQNTSLLAKVFVYTSRCFLVFLFSASRNKTAAELLSGCINLRSRVTFSRQNMCHFYSQVSVLLVTEESRSTSVSVSECQGVTVYLHRETKLSQQTEKYACCSETGIQNMWGLIRRKWREGNEK